MNIFQKLREIGTSRAKMKRKLSIAGTIFGYDAGKTSKMLLRRSIVILPNKPVPLGLPDLHVRSSERIGDNLCRIELESGRIFFGHRSEKKQYVWHQLFEDVIPGEIDGDAYKLALDIQKRYFGNKSLPWYFRKGGVYVEGGCYTGLKAMRWHDLLEGDCKIIAVEIGKSNYDIMLMNLRSNQMEGAIIPVNVGLWREDGTMAQKHSFTTRRFLEKTDRWASHFRNEEEARVVTIDTLLDEQGIEVVDYFNVQVNGAEIEVLKGLKNIHRVKVFGIAAYYGNGMVRNADVIRDMAKKMGCRIINKNLAGRIEFVTPRYIDEIMSMRLAAKAD
jgi:FkbM family methyltransferase